MHGGPRTCNHHLSSHSHLHLWEKGYFYYPHFTDENTDTHRSQAISLS